MLFSSEKWPTTHAQPPGWKIPKNVNKRNLHKAFFFFLPTETPHNKLDKKCKRPEANWMHELACRELNSDAFA